MKHKIEITDFSKNHTLTNLRVNKSETLVAFFVNTVDMENNCYKKDIVIIE